MEKIYQHIETLLVNHDYVILAGIGGFVIQNQSASINDGIITAPISTISFNPLMQHSDGLLAIEIARSEGLTYRKALELLQTEIDTIHNSLEKIRYFNLGRLGIIEKDDAGELIYTPPSDTTFIPANLGLKNIHFGTKVLENRFASRKISFTIPTARTFQYAATIALLFSMLLFSPKINEQKHTMSADIFSMSFAEAKPSTNIEALDIIAEGVEVENTDYAGTISEISEIIENSEIVEIETNSFHVIVASLATKAIADKYCQYLIEQDFNEACVLEPVKTFRVAIQSFSDRQKAIEFMRDLRKSDSQFEEAWVLCD